MDATTDHRLACALRHGILVARELTVLKKQAGGAPTLAQAVEAGFVADDIAADIEALIAANRPQGLEPSLPSLVLLREIGQGSNSRVFRAWQVSLRRLVAVKLVARDSMRSNEERVRFLREARIAAKLSHPALVRAYDVGQTTTHLYIVLEYVEGQTLKHRLEETETLAWREILHLAIGIAEGLAYAAAMGIAHRDIKPGNIQLSGDGSIKILDFGLARPQGSSTLTAPLVAHGTPAFIAPEQARGERELSPKVDVYALGAIIVRCATGSTLFQGKDAEDVLVRHMREVPPTLAQMRKDAPPELSELVSRMLAKSPEQRPDAAEVLSRLREIQVRIGSWQAPESNNQGREGLRGRAMAHPVSAHASSDRWLSASARRRLVLGALVLAVLVLAALLVWQVADTKKREEEMRLREAEDQNKLDAAQAQLRSATEYLRALEALKTAEQAERETGPPTESDLGRQIEDAVQENRDLLGESGNR